MKKHWGCHEKGTPHTKKKKPTKVGLIAISFKGYATYSVLYEGAVQVVQCL